LNSKKNQAMQMVIQVFLKQRAELIKTGENYE